MCRNEVYRVINSERDYQDSLPHTHIRMAAPKVWVTT